MIIQPGQITSYSLNRSSRGDDISKILAAAINGADAEEAIKKHISYDSNHLIIDKLSFNLSKFTRIFIIGVGKACVPMANAICQILWGKITSGLLITIGGYRNQGKNLLETQINIYEANHPIPDQRNMDAAVNLITLTKNINHDDLVIFLLSGGGSSLLMNPATGITLQDIQNTTKILISCGAPIHEINTIRKHLDVFKGGGLVKFLIPATVISLILSDVVGDNLEVIASGPTVDDPTSFNDAWAILNKYQILDKVPPRIISQLLAGIKGEIQETVKPGDPILSKVTNIIIGNNTDAVKSAWDSANKCGFDTRILTKLLQGEASQVGKTLTEEAKILLSPSSSINRPTCLIAGGETTVTIKGSGKGGRNQELALGAVNSLSGSEQLLLASLASDGCDGPTEAAGAVATNETFHRGLSLGLDPHEYLTRNDSFNYFKLLGDLIITGPTLTNVNDLVFIFCI